MTVGLKRFEQIIDAYGADPRRWPDDERASAQRLVATSAEARALVDQATPLDAWLDRADEAPPSDLLIRRTLKAAPGQTRVFGWASGTGWAAAAAAGLVLGLSLGQQAQMSSQADEALEQAAAWSVDEAEYFG